MDLGVDRTKFLAHILVLLLLVASPPTANSLRMINLDAPESSFQGDTIQLSCFYSLGTGASGASGNHQTGLQLTAEEKSAATSVALNGNHNSRLSKTSKMSSDLADGDAPTPQHSPPEQLYALKWYKDGREFFRYLAQDWPRKQSLPLEGLQVDVEKSDNHTVVLRNVTLRASGQFKCEVSTDAPTFLTKSMEHKMSVYLLPSLGPVIESSGQPASSRAGGGRGQEIRYSLGDQISLLCSAPESKPHASIDWIINETLNLSATSSAGDTNTHFLVSTQRSVRLPTPLGFSLRSANLGASQSASKSRLPSSKTTNLATYVILNDTLGLSEASGGIAVELGKAIEQVAESTSSQLNFTIDANLLQALVHRPANQNVRRQTNPNQILSNGASESATPSSVGREARRTMWPHGSDFHLNSRGRHNESLARQSSSGRQAPSGSFGELTFLSGISTNPKRMRKRPTATTMQSGDQEAHSLKVKCVARVLHLAMSDEVKLRPMDRLRVARVEELKLEDEDGWLRRQRLSKTQPGNAAAASADASQLTKLVLAISLAISCLISSSSRLRP